VAARRRRAALRLTRIEPQSATDTKTTSFPRSGWGAHETHGTSSRCSVNPPLPVSRVWRLPDHTAFQISPMPSSLLASLRASLGVSLAAKRRCRHRAPIGRNRKRAFNKSRRKNLPLATGQDAPARCNSTVNRAYTFVDGAGSRGSDPGAFPPGPSCRVLADRCQRVVHGGPDKPPANVRCASTWEARGRPALFYPTKLSYKTYLHLE
jgi:hypothetical protein